MQDAASRLVHCLRRRVDDERTHPYDAPDIGEALGERRCRREIPDRLVRENVVKVAALHDAQRSVSSGRWVKVKA